MQWKLQSRYHSLPDKLMIFPQNLEKKNKGMTDDGEGRKSGGEIQKIQYTNKNSRRRPEQL